MKEKVILSFGDNPKTSTGYGIVWDNLLTRWCKLKPNWKFYHLGWQNKDREHQRKEGYYMLPMNNKEYGYDCTYEYLMKYKPDYFITLCDVGWQSGYIREVRRAKKDGWNGLWIAYTPIDSHSWAWGWNEILDAPDINVAMAEWGRLAMNKRNVKKVRLIEHGVDTKIFKPLANKEELKKKYKLDKKFVVGFVGRNQDRKRIDILIRSFAEFSKDKDDVILMLHTDAEPPVQGWSMKYMEQKYKLEGKMFLSKTNLNLNIRQRISPNNMNEIYNLMDIFCYTTGGEGFGLPALECQASGIPLIMTQCTTAFELCRKENQIPILKDKYGRWIVDEGTNGVEFVQADDIECVKILNEKYKKWKNGTLEKEGILARKFSLKYDWDKVSEKWIKLFEEE